MADILIRNVEDEVAARLDADAARLGISRSEHLRRSLEAIAFPKGRTTLADLNRLGELARDLTDDDVMSKAWD